MNPSNPQSTEPTVVKAPAIPGGPVAEMEAEGQGQSTSIPDTADAAGARADQDIDTAGTEMDDEGQR
jgi:hypothetical protein